MIHRKNLLSWEQAACSGAGLVTAAASLWELPSTPLGYALVASGAEFVLTGVFGYCPMCTMTGRQPGGQDRAAGR